MFVGEKRPTSIGRGVGRPPVSPQHLVSPAFPGAASSSSRPGDHMAGKKWAAASERRWSATITLARRRPVFFFLFVRCARRLAAGPTGADDHQMISAAEPLAASFLSAEKGGDAGAG